MEIKRLDEDTMECSLTPEELKKKGISLDEATLSSHWETPSGSKA